MKFLEKLNEKYRKLKILITNYQKLFKGCGIMIISGRVGLKSYK